jgi:cation transport protein ChaC
MLAVMTHLTPADVDTDWVFGYGSLIWNPEFEFERADLATAYGYHRAFCVRSTRYRGTPQRPGVVLGLDRGGSCVGVAYRLSAASRDAAIGRLFQREIPDPANRIYLPRIITVRLSDRTEVRALTFVADRERPSYHRLSTEEILDRLTGSAGQRGANRDYAVNTLEALHARGVRDARLSKLVQMLDAAFKPPSDEAASGAAPLPSGIPSGPPESDDCAG